LDVAAFMLKTPRVRWVASGRALGNFVHRERQASLALRRAGKIADRSILSELKP
jgi:hypothetical protein